jgi:hypothetical protein
MSSKYFINSEMQLLFGDSPAISARWFRGHKAGQPAIFKPHADFAQQKSKRTQPRLQAFRNVG